MQDRAAYWESIYATKGDADLSWFQATPGCSMQLVSRIIPRPNAAIDVGGGQSALAGELLGIGVSTVVVLDISPSAIRRGQERLGPYSSRVRWIEADILRERELGPFDLWHDRACFHFLTEKADRQRYVNLAARSVAPGGHAIIAGFGAGGPDRCSGLPVQRWSPGELAQEFSSAFVLSDAAREEHSTPWGKPQEFSYVLLRRQTDHRYGKQ